LARCYAHVFVRTSVAIVTERCRLLQLAVYHLKIVAVDGGVPALTSTTDVTVGLLDVNDSPPQFTNSNFTATVQVSWSPHLGVSHAAAAESTNHWWLYV